MAPNWKQCSTIKIPFHIKFRDARHVNARGISKHKCISASKNSSHWKKKGTSLNGKTSHWDQKRETKAILPNRLHGFN